jgi:hypothetical protein
VPKFLDFEEVFHVAMGVLNKRSRSSSSSKILGYKKFKKLTGRLERY